MKDRIQVPSLYCERLSKFQPIILPYPVCTDKSHGVNSGAMHSAEVVPTKGMSPWKKINFFLRKELNLIIPKALVLKEYECFRLLQKRYVVNGGRTSGRVEVEWQIGRDGTWRLTSA